MTGEQITQALRRWDEAMSECNQRMDQLSELTGQVVYSPLGDAVFGLMGEYTRQLADQIGWDCDALHAWWLEHNFGERPMNMGFPGEQLRSISTIDQLADFVFEDIARAE